VQHLQPRVFPGFVAYPYVYGKIAGDRPGRARITVAAIAAAVAGLQLGAFAVVLETASSGITALPFSTFVVLMQPIHLAIGIVEGIVTAAVVAFVHKAPAGDLAGAARSGGRSPVPPGATSSWRFSPPPS